jgi:hypothetical protein
MRRGAILLVASLSLGLAGCNRASEGNPGAPGSPGTGNPREVARPTAADTPSGGLSGVKGSLPHAGSSGGDAPPGATGSGTADAGGQNQASQPGAGLAGGMSGSSGLGMTGTFPAGTGTQSAGAGAASSGSPNRSPRSGVGTR